MDVRVSHNLKASSPFVLLGSPFTCMVSDIRKVMVSGEGLEKVPIGRPAVFTVDAQEDVGYEPEIKITGKKHLNVYSRFFNM